MFILKRARDGGWWYRPLQRELVEAGVRAVDYQRLPGTRLAGRVLSKLGWQCNLWRGRSAVLALTGWSGTPSLFPVGFWCEPVIYSMDCWQSQWDRWATVLRRNRVRLAMFSARQSAVHLARRLPDLKTHWVPEAVDDGTYEPSRPLGERSIDVLEFGRKYPAFTQAVADGLAAEGRRHLYPTQQRLFADHAAVVDALADAKLLVCYPRCDTHPQVAGTVETLTLRYLEGMASGCLVIGRAPRELIDLFGYNPVVDVDVNDRPIDRVRDLLADVGRHQALVERNLARLREVCTWRIRAHQMLDILELAGYAPLGR
jgi:hypothetical protein